MDDYLDRGMSSINFPAYTDYQNPDRIIVDKVVKYEYLAKELSEIFDQFGIPFDGNLGNRAKGGYRKDRRDYREVLTASQADKIAKIYHQEIKLLNYEY
ncbi:MAG: hypothetical protein BMS9Abin33_1261 [Gammaproteobacteria bacterium]|nr:MAG: hypothetical protein BMS9Abin33_1261 [Gammaproteobacteria bacterium]